MNDLTDLQLIDKYIDESRQFVPPLLFRDIRNRGLYDIINFLPHDICEAKAVARARLSKQGKYFGDPEIDQIAGEIMRINSLRDQLKGMNMADVDKTIPIMEEMVTRSEFDRDYYKIKIIP